MFCLKCDAEKNPVQVIGPDGIVDACPTCQSVFARRGASPDEPAQAQPVPVAKPATASVVGTTFDIVAAMLARLAIVEAEIAARAKFETERDMLRRMLASVGEEPLSISLTK